jgi:hypothetical protein
MQFLQTLLNRAKHKIPSQFESGHRQGSETRNGKRTAKATGHNLVTGRVDGRVYEPGSFRAKAPSSSSPFPCIRIRQTSIPI